MTDLLGNEIKGSHPIYMSLQKESEADVFSESWNVSSSSSMLYLHKHKFNPF